MAHLGFRLAALLFLATPDVTGAAECPDNDPERQAFFGDLHIHTAVSADAYLFGTTNRPNDAYRFARGETLEVRQQSGTLPPKPARLERPLDFAAVTDHAEALGAVSLCTTPGTEEYGSALCRRVREPQAPKNLVELSQGIGAKFQDMYSSELCGEDGARCAAAAASPWKEARNAAAQANDPCEFTAFVGYEYSPTPDNAKVHHNVIFRSEAVIGLPIPWNVEPSVYAMWQRLESECTDAGTGCDVLTIPHNSNLSNGRMFRLDYDGETDPAKQADLARLRARIEPVVEIFQFKGDSECRNGLWNVLGTTDELCEFEKFRKWQGAEHEDCKDGVGVGALSGKGCVSRQDYARTALASGLAEQRRIGVNPFKFSFIGSTDAHDGSAGDTDEWVRDGIARQPAPYDPGRDTSGGLAAVWSEENTRESLFDAMQRRETFATSGPRMSVRFFGGWHLPEDLCSHRDLVAQGYAKGVPMGADLPARKSDAAPRFVVSAASDPGTKKHPSGLLQRAQIIKVWAGEGAEFHQQVFDVAGGENDASVNLDTCTPKGKGATTLCGVWQDPNFKPEEGATYYARVVENPSCRHTGWACANTGPGEKPAFCADASIAKQGQERAWTAPIWYSPAGH
ncbi:MAG: DUF3604 domain-containing protein [Deltaproteobacteria bacterium]|nr:DUF3604 domain-containing protein [Deltaproteobacteria bacterium]